MCARSWGTRCNVFVYTITETLFGLEMYSWNSSWTGLRITEAMGHEIKALMTSMDDVLDAIIMTNAMHSYENNHSAAFACLRSLKFLTCPCVESQSTVATHRLWMFANITNFPLFIVLWPDVCGVKMCFPNRNGNMKRKQRYLHSRCLKYMKRVLSTREGQIHESVCHNIIMSANQGAFIKQ